METEAVAVPAIEMIEVTSSQIAKIGHDPATSTMAIRFPAKTGSGSLYHYANVTAEQFEALMAAESKGSHFIKHFKKNEAHPYTRVE